MKVMAAPVSTRDPAEIAKFAKLAADWWDPKGPFGALHRMNPARLGFIREKALRHFSSPLAGEVSAKPTEGGRATTRKSAPVESPPPPTPSPQWGGGANR